MSDYYEDRIADLNDEIDNLNDEMSTLESELDFINERDTELKEYVANELCSPAMKLWQTDRIVKWLVGKVLELEKEKVNE